MKRLCSLTTYYGSVYHLIFPVKTGSDLQELSVRITHVATIDGGAVSDHLGYTEADRKLEIKAYLTENQYNTLYTMISTYTDFTVSITEIGLFTGKIQNVAGADGEYIIMFLVDEKI